MRAKDFGIVKAIGSQSKSTTKQNEIRAIVKKYDRLFLKAKTVKPVNGKMNGLRPPWAAPPVFAVGQLRGDSLKCCRPLLL